MPLTCSEQIDERLLMSFIIASSMFSSNSLSCLFCRHLVLENHGETRLIVVDLIWIISVEDLSCVVVVEAELLGSILLAVCKSSIDLWWSVH